MSTAEKVAHAFVEQYYAMMASDPRELHRFYSESSQFCHSEDPSGAAESVVGLKAIAEKIEDANFLHCVVDLTEGAFDFQEISIADNLECSPILVVVTGHFSKKGSVPRQFTHTFMLAKPETSAWCVMNSVFRLQSGIIEPAVEEVVSNGEKAPLDAQNVPAQAPLVEEQPAVKTPVASPSTVSEAETTAKAPVDDVVDEEPIVVVATAAVSPEPAQKDVTVAKEDSGPRKPLSFADMAKKNSNGGASVVLPPAPRAAKPAPKKTTEKPKEVKKAVAVDKAQLENAHNSMYIKQVTNQVTDAALRELFGQFGTITRCDLQASKAFAFIDFSTRESLLAALSSKQPLVCCGATLKVEERAPKPKDKESGGQRGNKNKSSGSNDSGGKKKDGSRKNNAEQKAANKG